MKSGCLAGTGVPLSVPNVWDGQETAAQHYKCLGCILFNGSFYVAWILRQKITLESMIGTMSNIQFSFLFS